MFVESDSVFYFVGFTSKFTYDWPVVSNHKNSGVFVLCSKKLVEKNGPSYKKNKKNNIYLHLYDVFFC